MRVVMPVIVSRRQRLLLLMLFLLLLWPTASLIRGWQWGLFLPCWLTGLWLAWRRVMLIRGELIWDGEWLEWQGRRYRLGARCRILPGVLWLRLREGELPEVQLWLCSDALAPAHYRALARAIHLNPPR
jgi:toxin CptA